jgi:cytochrome c553
MISTARCRLRLHFAAGALLIVAGAASGAEPARTRVPDTIAERVRACTGCHGKEGRATSEGYYPRIAGKPARYLYNQLVNFRDGLRRHQTMTYIVGNLPDDYLREIAAYFATQDPPYPPPPAADATPAVLARGKTLVTRGDPANKIPACAECHGDTLTGVAPAIPGLLGLPRDYLNSQFGAWRIGARHAAAPDCMAEIARRLSNDDISAVTRYLASRAVPPHTKPASALPAKLPLDCGGVR